MPPKAVLETPTAGGSTAGKATSKSFVKKPNYNLIHADPLPLKVQSAPPLIPQNPLSILHHLYLYLTSYAPAKKKEYIGIFSPISMSVEVTDPHAVLDLWQKGFWGKGSLSRSEPTWLQREKRRLGDTEVKETSEEITRRRREERKEFKKERARKEKEELERVKAEEAKSKVKDKSESKENKPILVDSKVVVQLEDEIEGLDEAANEKLEPSQPPIAAATGLPTPPLSAAEESGSESVTVTTVIDTENETTLPISSPPIMGTPVVSEEVQVVRFDEIEKKIVAIEDKEHLQLTLQEALFLSFALGVLSVRTASDASPLTVANLLNLCIRYSSFPPLPESSVSLVNLDPSSDFLVKYVVYHHFRSLGWVVKSGVKFSVDYLIYKRGPVFTHAEFALVVLPSFSRWEEREDVEPRSWHWLHSITRVNSQVKKTVVLVYVDVPTPKEVEGWEGEKDGLKGVLSRYRIREVALKRWTPGRNRE